VQEKTFHKRLPVSTFSIKSPLQGLWSWLLKGFSKLVSNFKGARYKNLEFEFFHQQRNKKLEKQSAHVQKVPIYYYKPSKKCSSRATISLSLMKIKWYTRDLKSQGMQTKEKIRLMVIKSTSSQLLHISGS
jgi:hypothetical protein